MTISNSNRFNFILEQLKNVMTKQKFYLFKRLIWMTKLWHAWNKRVQLHYLSFLMFSRSLLYFNVILCTVSLHNLGDERSTQLHILCSSWGVFLLALLITENKSCIYAVRLFIAFLKFSKPSFLIIWVLYSLLLKPHFYWLFWSMGFYSSFYITTFLLHQVSSSSLNTLSYIKRFLKCSSFLRIWMFF